MQPVGLLSAHLCSESLEYGTNNLDAQSSAMTCPQCGNLCPSIGKVKKNWYALCSCGTYIQQCSSVEDYCD